MKLSKAQIFGLVVMAVVAVGGLGYVLVDDFAGAAKILGWTAAIIAGVFVLAWLMQKAQRRPRGSGLAEAPWAFLRGLDAVLKIGAGLGGATVGEPSEAPAAKSRKKTRP